MSKVWWMIHKDLVSECRGRQVWPAMLLLGMVVVLIFAMQLDLPMEHRGRVVGCLLWVAVLFAGTISLDRSFGLEREEDCLEGLLLYPSPVTAVYLAKLIVNFVVLSCLECVLIPLFTVLSNAPLMSQPWAMLLVALFANLAIAAVGTLFSAATSGFKQHGNLLALLVLPLSVPIVLSAAEATRLMVAADRGLEWWRWVQLLGACAAVFITAGVVLFDFVVED